MTEDTKAMLFRIARGMSLWAVVAGVCAAVVAVQALTEGRADRSSTWVLFGIFVVVGIGGLVVFLWIFRHRDIRGRRR